MHMTDKEVDEQMALLGESIVNMQLSFIERKGMTASIRQKIF